MNLSVRRVAAMLRAAPRPELEQAVLRMLVSALIVAYMAFCLSGQRIASVNKVVVISAVAVFFAVAAAMVIRILVYPRASVARRVFGMLVDNAATTYSMILMDEGGAVIIGAYLFVALGNGFRYGRRYLHASQIMACLGFGIVLVASPFWSRHTAIGLGFLITLVVVPLYVGVLAERIKKARRRADEANQAKGRFLANVSHEMRTPLNGVIAMADLLRDTRLSEPQAEIVQTLGTSAQLLLAQIEDVLDISRIEAGRIAINARLFDLRMLITSTVKVMIPQARHKGLAVEIDLPDALATHFRGDDHHLRQVLLNLLANAVKFTEKGEVSLSVAEVNAPDDTACLRFEVRDTGIGIPADKLESIFEAFTQADDSITRRYGGTGLGTTIAKQLVTLMGGRIGVQSELGAGSTFWFEVPLARSDGSDLDHAASEGPSEELGRSPRFEPTKLPTNISRLRGARVLVAEDNATNQRVTQLILESGGHAATIVGNGEAALDALEEGRFDIALFDLSMPVLSGIQALRMYRFTTAKPIPILILSANVTPDVIAECEKAGCAEFVPKPLRATSLLDAVERHLIAPETATPPSPVPSEAKPSLSLVDTPVVDAQVLEDLGRLSTDPTFVERLVAGFRSDADRIAADVMKALETRRYEEIKDIAHALKGGSASVGALQLMHFAARLEKAGTDVLRQRPTQHVEEMQRTIKEAFRVLDQFVEQRRERLRSAYPE